MAYPKEIPQLNRRRFGQLLIAGTAAIIAPQLIQPPYQALAQRIETTWPVKPALDIWFPSIPGRTNNGGNLYKVGGPLHIYDQANDFETDVRGKVEAIFKQKYTNGELDSSSGFCAPLANVIARLAYLEAAGIISSPQADEIRVDENKLGLLVAVSAGDVAKRVAWTPLHPDSDENKARNNDDNLNMMVKEQRIFAAQMNYLPGRWYFLIHGIEGSNVIATGFGETRRMPMANIINSYVPVRFHEAKSMNLDPYLLYEQHMNRYSEQGIGFNEEKVRQMLGIYY